MSILGISFGYHDAAAALIDDGVVVAAAQEERFTRVKNDPSFPQNAIEFCLEHAGVAIDQIEQVVFYEDPYLKLDRVMKTIGRFDYDRQLQVLATLFEERRFDLLDDISQRLRCRRDRVSFVCHHLSHAAASFYCSPFSEATILTLDGIGEWDSCAVSSGNGIHLEKRASTVFPRSVGLVYSAFTAYLGFKVNEGEYKVMGMAAYGQPILRGDVASIFRVDPDGSLFIDQRYFDFTDPTKPPYTAAFIARFGEPRVPESELRLERADSDRQRYADLAASIQSQLEQVVLELARKALADYPSPNLCLGGGVALNSCANGLLQRELGVPLFIQPAAGDAGSAVGAALYYHHHISQKPRKEPLRSCYLGVEYDDETIRRAIADFDLTPSVECMDWEEVTERTATLLDQGKVIGWFQGRFEFGPRALGNRSILANPTLAAMKQVVNEKIKYRESFRPFAPSVAVDEAARYFENFSPSAEVNPDDFMLSVCQVRPDVRAALPAITHNDGTARIQIVRPEISPLYYQLLRAFEKRSGFAVLLNTSFNVQGEPIVASPTDALNTFVWSGLDALVLGMVILIKDDQ